MKIGIVGGSDYPKIAEQLGEGDDGEQASSCFHQKTFVLVGFSAPPEASLCNFVNI